MSKEPSSKAGMCIQSASTHLIFGRTVAHLHVIEFFPIVADLVASTDPLAMVEAGYERSAAFRQRFVAFDLSLIEPVAMCCAHRARWLPGPPARAFMSVLAGG